ncbi:hypothetical protein BU198_39885 [Streptomyces sp. CBMA156]|nr:hypothetical protein [Streptomyces sp. CBMA156]
MDTHEADRIEWIPVSRIQGMIDRREIVAGVAVTGLLQARPVSLDRQESILVKRPWYPRIPGPARLHWWVPLSGSAGRTERRRQPG